jgi:hypothetical protein
MGGTCSVHEICKKCLYENLKGSNDFGYIGLCGKIILKSSRKEDVDSEVHKRLGIS